MVDGSGLENRRTRKGTGGSNPSLSAMLFVINKLYAGEISNDNGLNRRLVPNELFTQILTTPLGVIL